MSISFRFTFFSDTSLFDYFCYNFRIIVSVKKCFLSTLIPCFDMYVKIIDEIIFLLLWSLGIDQKDGSARILTLSAVSLKGLDHTVNFYLYLVSIQTVPLPLYRTDLNTACFGTYGRIFRLNGPKKQEDSQNRVAQFSGQPWKN